MPATTIQLPLQSDEAHSPDVTPFGLVWHGGKGLYTAVPPANTTRFPDVPIMHVYKDSIEGMAEAEIIEGFIRRATSGPNTTSPGSSSPR